MRLKNGSILPALAHARLSRAARCDLSIMRAVQLLRESYSDFLYAAVSQFSVIDAFENYKLTAYIRTLC
jgi:hypothetical protein